MDVRNGAVSNCSMGQSNSSERCEHCGALMVLVMPVDGKGPGALRCWECDRVDPMQLPSTTAWLVDELRRWMIAIREDIAMAFFKRELSPVERFESALKDKEAQWQKLHDGLSIAETVLGEKRVAAERLAVAGASNAQLDRAEANMCAVEDRAKTLRAALVEFDEQIVSTQRALADAKAQHDRELVADEIEAMAAAIEQAAPGFNAGAAALVEAVTKGAASMPEATRFATSVDAVRREVLSAADLVCWELWTSAVRTRAGNANIVFRAPLEPCAPAAPSPIGCGLVSPAVRPKGHRYAPYNDVSSNLRADLLCPCPREFDRQRVFGCMQSSRHFRRC